MTKKETITLLSMIKTAYPKTYANLSPEEANKTVELWSTMLKEYSYDIVFAALKTYIASEKFAPAVSDIIERIKLITEPGEVSEYEIWEDVRKAVCGDALYNPEKAFNSLPAIAQKIIKSPSQLKQWATMDSGEFETVVASNFMRSYKTALAQQKAVNSMPNDVKALIDETAKKLDSPKI